MSITPHFSIQELSATNTGLSNDPPESVKRCLCFVASKLEIIRSAFNRPLYVVSGYRSERVNRAVGGSPTSLHLTGLAVDISIKNIGYDDMPKFLDCVLSTDPIEIHFNSSDVMHIAWHPFVKLLNDNF